MEYRGLERLNDAVYLAQKGDEKGRGAQIVFIRGLQFQEEKNQFPDNWLSEDGTDLWPKSWLSQSFPTAAIYLVDFDSSTSKNDRKGRLDMFATAESLLHNLFLAKIGQSPRNPVILVGQDIGGLVIKEICLQAFLGASLVTGDAMHQKKRSFLQQVKGVFYFSTPHSGIRQVHWDQDYQSELVKSFMVHNEATSRTNEDFRKMRKQYEWRAFGLGASHQGKGHVEEASARHDVDQFCIISASTRDICRPKDRTSSSFLLLENFIQETLSGIMNLNRVKVPFRADPQYVPLKQTVREIRQRLEHPEIQVVVLHGDAGTGKTSLTKYVALQYEEEIGSKSTFWDGIFYFECGRGKKAATVLRNMLLQLHVHVDGNIISSDDVDGMRLLLSERLQKLSALMIFDDVWDVDRKSLVEKAVVPTAREVKYLLSSQQSLGWRGYSTYQIEAISLATAQQIIINHVGLRDGEIPRDDKEIVNEIIQMTESHPLALATISGSVRVDREGRVRRAVWEDLRQNLLVYLAEDEPSATATIFGEQYPRSVFAAMMYAVDLLRERKDESMYLLCIMALFKSPFPASLVHMVIFCARPQLSKDVYRLITRLQDRQLVEGALDRKFEVPQPFLHTPYAGMVTAVSYLKMHGLRQQFILTCAEYASDYKNSVEVIKETIAPFLSATSFGGVHEFEHRAEHPSPAVLITAFCAVYGIADVKNAAACRLCNYQLKIPVGAQSEGFRLNIAPRISTQHGISIPHQDIFYRTAMPSVVYHAGELLELHHPKICLEVLMAQIENHGTKANIQSALQKLVWKYMFQLQIDDDSLSLLISEGYDCALTFLIHHISGMVMKLAYREHSTDEMLSWDPISRSLAAASSLLCTETQSNLQNLRVLNLLRDLAMFVRMTSGKVYVDAFDLEVLINMFYRGHVDSPDPLSLSSNLIQLFGSLADDVKIRSQLICHLRARRGMQEAINSVVEKLVAELNSNRHLELLESSNSNVYTVPSAIYRIYDRSDSSKSLNPHLVYQVDILDYTVNPSLVYTLYQVDTILKAARLLRDLWPRSFREETVLATVTSISKPIQALLRLIAYQTLSDDPFYQCAHSLHCVYLFQAYGSIAVPARKYQIGRSVIWCIPGATQALVSLVSRPLFHELPYTAHVGLSLLAARISSAAAIGDDGIRSYFLTEGFVDMLVEYIGDYIANIISETRVLQGSTAVTVIRSIVTYDDTAASFCSSLPKLHRVLCQYLSCAPTEDSSFSALTVLLYLGYSIGVNDHMQSSSCCILQAITPKHSHSAVVESSHAMKVANAFESLFGIIDNNGHKVAQVAALRLLLYLIQRHWSARARIYAMRATATRLSLLLLRAHGEDAVVQELALGAIVDLILGSQVYAAKRFLVQVVVIPGVIETIVESTVHDWGGRKRALSCVLEYLSLYPHLESARPSRILAVRDFVPGMVLSLQNKDHDIESRRFTLAIFVALTKATGSCSFFLPIRGSVEALVELSSHLTRKLVEQPSPCLQLVGSDQEHERTALLRHYLEFLYLLAESEGAVSRIVASERVFDPIIDLFDDKQRETKQEESCADLDQETCTWSAIRFVCTFARCKRNAIPEKIIELVSRALQNRVDLLTDINGAQVPVDLTILLFMLMSSKASKPFIARALGFRVEILIPLCVHHEQRIVRANAFDILRCLLITLRFEDFHAFTRCLSKVLVVFPAIVDQLQHCLVEQDKLKYSVVCFLIFLAETRIYNKMEVLSLVRSKVVSILYNPQALQNVAGLLQRDDHEPEVDRIHELVMYFLRVTANDTVKGMFRIVQIPGTLERIVELVSRGNADAFLFVQKLISIGKLYARAPRYLLKCLCRVASARMGERSASEPLHLVGLCALRNLNALRYLIDMLHESVRCILRGEAMHYLISHVSDNTKLPTRTLLASLQSFAYDPTRYECLGPAYDLQREVLCVLVSLVERSPQSQWRITKYVTGLSAHDLRTCMPTKACDLKRN